MTNLQKLGFWLGFLALQILVVAASPHHGPQMTLPFALLFTFFSGPGWLSPSGKFTRGTARLFFLIFVSVFVWESLAPLAYGFGTPFFYLVLVCAPAWLLHGLQVRYPAKG